MTEALLVLVGSLSSVIVALLSLIGLLLRRQNGKRNNPGHDFRQVEQVVRECFRHVEEAVDGGFKGIHERLDRQADMLSRLDERTSR